MSTNERDTHFAGFANLQYSELERFFADLFWQRLEGKYENARINEMVIKKLLAQRDYDLARHIVWETMGGTPNAITIILADVPDLTAWPDTSPPS